MLQQQLMKLADVFRVYMWWSYVPDIDGTRAKESTLEDWSKKPGAYVSHSLMHSTENVKPCINYIA